MMVGFPIATVPLLRCTVEGSALRVAHGTDGVSVEHGSLACTSCGLAYRIDDGILDMLGTGLIDHESLHERTLRDGQEVSMPTDDRGEYGDAHNRMEMLPTLEALDADGECDVLELGCGDGRYTMRLAGRCRTLVAVDFSRPALVRLRQRLPSSVSVALIVGDVGTLAVKAGAFDRVLCTLMSNLPTREHREATYRLAARALRPSGRFVFSTHHHSVRDRLAGRPKSGRYREGGIYRYCFGVRECASEARGHFLSVHARPLRVYLPLSRKLRLPLLLQSRIAERIPVLNRLADLVLCSASDPTIADSKVLQSGAP